jgi:SAM-dependent methyltransferase
VDAYDARFYEDLEQTSGPSARVIVPLVMELVRPKSVIDVGCGLGTWLAVFKESGVKEIRGVDGPWVSGKELAIPSDRLTIADLTKPFRTGERYDLVVSLEVAEHLPASCAAAFVETLTSLGPVVLFSAAVPFQGGNHHLNEKWPDYWAGLFAERGYSAVDCIREKVWRDERVSWWYAQNLLMYAAAEHLQANPTLRREAEAAMGLPLAIAHPRHCESMVDRLTIPRELMGVVSLRRALASLPWLAGRAIANRLRGLLGKEPPAPSTAAQRLKTQDCDPDRPKNGITE